MFGFIIIFQIIVGVLMFSIFAVVIGMLVSPKLRSKITGHQLKIQKKVLEDNKETIQDINELQGEIGIKSKRNIIDSNEEDLETISTKNAKINREAIKMTASAIKEGLYDEEKIFCKHCGASIDEDSRFCKKCGQEQ